MCAARSLLHGSANVRWAGHAAILGLDSHCNLTQWKLEKLTQRCEALGHPKTAPAHSSSVDIYSSSSFAALLSLFSGKLVSK